MSDLQPAQMVAVPAALLDQLMLALESVTAGVYLAVLQTRSSGMESYSRRERAKLQSLDDLHRDVAHWRKVAAAHHREPRTSPYAPHDSASLELTPAQARGLHQQLQARRNELAALAGQLRDQSIALEKLYSADEG